MKSALQLCKLLVKKSSIHGYGVFADQEIAPGTIIEEAHTIACSEDDRELLNYVFSGKGKNIIALGYGSIYNHSPQPNAEFEFLEETKLMVFRAKRWIKQGEEIYISYGKHWFGYRKMQIKSASLWFRLRKRILPMSAKFLLICGFITLFLYVLPRFSGF